MPNLFYAHFKELMNPVAAGLKEHLLIKEWSSAQGTLQNNKFLTG